MSQQSILAAEMASSILDHMNRVRHGRLMEFTTVIYLYLPLYLLYLPLVSSYLETVSSLDHTV